MRAKEIRETYLSFFAERGHKIVPSASLVPSVHDPSVLLTTAGMQPFKPYFLGREQPPAPRLADVQKCFRTTDIEEVGNTARHMTFFEMLGNWSFGDYFKAESIPWGWELSTQGFGMDPKRIWVTVFGGDEELGLGPDEEAIEIWRATGVPEERIVRLGREDNFWQAGPTGPCGPCSELYLDRGLEFGAEGERPGDDTDRFLEFWNHVFMSYDLAEDGSLTELPMKNIDTGMGLDRMAAVLQDVPSVFETDHVRPLLDLAEELSGRRYDEGGAVTRAMRIVADHSRGAAFLIADGVVPSNEDRGYILRRIMRRAIQQGRTLGLEAPWLSRFAERTIELMGEDYPELVAERETIGRWVRDEEESFGRTLERGSELLERLVSEAKQSETSWIEAAEAFKLHDTYGFPYDLTKELLAERGLSVDDQGFQELMEEQRQRARTASATAHGSENTHERVLAFAEAAPPTRFVGYETLRVSTGIAAVESLDGDFLVKLDESPFYAEGGGQVADSGVLRAAGFDIAVKDVYRLGEDQALLLEADPGEVAQIEAEVDAEARHATMRNHTATHLLHAALRERLGTHVRQAGSAVRPDKLRFDFTHGQALSPEELRDVEERINEWVKASRPVRWMNMNRTDAEKLGAMALFGEKYGEWVRVVEVDGVSRELCGGTHVANTAEVGIFKLVSEGSSAANVRRVEAITGPAAIDWYREREAQLQEAGELLGNPQDPVAAARRAAEQLKQASAGAEKAQREQLGGVADDLAGEAEELPGGGRLVAVTVDSSLQANPKQLLDLANRIQSKLGQPSAVVLGGEFGGKAGLVALVSKEAVERGLAAGAIIREIAPIVGGGGGGRDDMAQAGGKDPAKLDEALAAARAAIERELG
jgi:alanyl-tRNA synthetase